MGAGTLLNLEGVVYVSSLVNFNPEQPERWKGTLSGCSCALCESWQRYLRVLQKAAPWLQHSVARPVSACVSLGYPLSLGTGSTGKWKNNSHIHWPGTENRGSLGTWGWGPASRQEESLGPGAAGDGSHL